MAVPQTLKTLRRDIKTWTWHHLAIFLLTFFIYAFLHACRKSFSNIKNTMEKSLSPKNDSMYPYQTWQKEQMFDGAANANVFLGELDLLFMLAYAIGLYFSGYIVDRVNLRYMLSLGMFASALMTFTFGYLSVAYNVRNRNYFRITYFLNGLFQSTGWPVTVTIVGNWFSKSSAGIVFGCWSSNQSLGNIIGSLIVAGVIDYGYEYGMLLNSLLLLCGTCVVFVCLIPHPNDISLPSPDEEDETNITSLREGTTIREVSDEECELNFLEHSDSDNTMLIEQNQKDKNTPKPVGFIEACLIPGVFWYALSFACLKMVNYSLFFWLPTYLSQGLHWDDKSSDRVSNFYDIGQVLGGIITGVITDIMGKRSPVICSMLLLSMLLIYLYSILGRTLITNIILMAITGFLVGGPANIISTATTVDLGKHEKLKGNTKALGTVVGIIDGTGSAGAAAGQYLVAIIIKYGGWEWVFYFLIIMQGFSLLFIIIKHIKMCN